MYQEKPKIKEEYTVALDYLPNGYAFDNKPTYKKNAIVQAIGKKHLILLELVPKKDVFISPYEEVYVGEGKREKIHHIMGKLPYDRLTQSAKAELEFVIAEIVEKDEKRFIDFFNKARPLTTRMHQLELLPGLGKKHMWQVIEERDVEPFKDFEDLRKRVKLIPDPKKLLIRRILKEISTEEKHNLFVQG